MVKAGRGKRLKDAPELFSGLFWTGQQAVEMGLADQLGNLDFVAREVIKAEELVDYTRRDNVAERLAKKFGAADRRRRDARAQDASRQFAEPSARPLASDGEHGRGVVLDRHPLLPPGLDLPLCGKPPREASGRWPPPTAWVAAASCSRLSHIAALR